jgi:putative spermidine/putrescine transport system ATP-binding protein
MAVSDRVGVMADGRLEQIGTPLSIYRQPATPFVARFVGTVTSLDGVARPGGVEIAGRVLPVAAINGRDPGTAVRLLVRPEAVLLGPETEGLPGTVTAQSFRGAVTRLVVRLDGGVAVEADVPSTTTDTVAAGVRVGIRVSHDGVFVEDR